MTIVATHVTNAEAIVIADSRLSLVDARGRMAAARDVCQKLFLPNAWSLVGFSGNLCMGRHIWSAISARLLETDARNPDWLRDDEMLRSFIRRGLQLRVEQRPTHTDCPKQPVEVMVVWLNIARGSAQATGSLQPLIEILRVRTPDLRITRSYMTFETVGSGARISTELTRSLYVSVANFGIGDQEYGLRNRALFFAKICRDLVEDDDDGTVGGLYQIATQ